MTANFAPFYRTVLGALICLVAGIGSPPAHAQTRMRAHYTISMTGVSIGQITWSTVIGDERYTTSANGKASGVLSVLVNGEGSVDIRGLVVDGHLSPQIFTSTIVDDEGKSELRMVFDDGAVKELIAPPPPPGSDRVVVKEADIHNVSDPLSAMLITADDPLASANCKRVLAIFDGQRRYDLALSFKRVEKVAIEHSYSGLVLVCGVVLHPIAGYRADSKLVKYVAGRRDMELWFAPIAGTPLIAPIRVLMPTLIGTLEIAADQFNAVALPPPPEAPPAAAPR
ncbi:MAG: DUF3108 domain-containing protein [Pseudolabrys sp.]|jgi:hypothetical protein